MQIREVLNQELFTLTGTVVTVGSVLAAVVVLLATLILSRIVRRLAASALRRGGVKEPAAVGTVDRVLYYSILVAGMGVALTTLGIDMSALFATGAVAAVAVAFAMQNILQNFVSGVILLAERSITPADVLVVEGQMVRVERMGIRATIVRSTDEEEIILPNSILVQTSVKNLTLADELFRVRTRVGVSYATDLEKAAPVLAGAAARVDGRSAEREPVVLLAEFGDSSIVFDVSIWIDNPWTVQGTRSALNLAVWRGLRAAGIVIAFPQLDVHLVSNPAGVGASGPAASGT